MSNIFGSAERSLQQAGKKHPYWFLVALAAALGVPVALYALNPSLPPGKNFNLSVWELQLPIGSTDNPTTESNQALEDGFTDSYFFTNSSDGAMGMKDPGSNCVTTSGSEHCRTELREVNTDGSAANWSPSNTNKLKATLAVEEVGSGSSVVIGQVHFEDSISSKPMCELYYDSNGDIKIGVEENKEGGDQGTPTYVGNVAVGKSFSYEINYSNNSLLVSLNGGTPMAISTKDSGGLDGYFKAGDYGQSTAPSDVHFFALTIIH